MAKEEIIAKGLATPCPAISGALPWHGSYIPCPELFSDAEGSIPMDPLRVAAISDKISPNRLPETITSYWFGLSTSCIAVLSASWCESSTSGYSGPISVTMSRQNFDTSRTFAFSTEHNFLFLFIAASNATFAIRLISSSL